MDGPDSLPNSFEEQDDFLPQENRADEKMDVHLSQCKGKGPEEDKRDLHLMNPDSLLGYNPTPRGLVIMRVDDQVANAYNSGASWAEMHRQKSMLPVILIVGRAASGKSTLAARLAKDFGFYHVSLHEHCQEMARWLKKDHIPELPHCVNVMIRRGEPMHTGLLVSHRLDPRTSLFDYHTANVRKENRTSISFLSCWWSSRGRHGTYLMVSPEL
ncbi:Uu.00g004870.m01.CDS01 [Anthostomella pinea]|uniref:Uu.00g004870.m01.CDS01 n=1 Tax=Anthostomella pinea TaxID=933095 RepID=A0AAI8VKR0_9PEZI|nr:Uu.00g004870.m01.CDS01 [Anthostomella pinea]